MKGHKVEQVLMTLFPLDLGYEWDNNGLQIGSLDKEINKIMISLDITKKVVEEAIAKDIDLIIAHHPLIFQPIKAIDTTGNLGSILESLIKNDITVYITHTNFDLSKQGMNDVLAEMLGITNTEPIDYIDEVHGLGRIGNIKECNLDDYIQHVKKVFKLKSVKLIGTTSQKITRVAVCGGSGSSIIHQVHQAGADLYITGDIGYHHALDAHAIGLTILDVGHHVEKYFMPRYRELLHAKGITCEIVLSEADTTPYTYL